MIAEEIDNPNWYMDEEYERFVGYNDTYLIGSWGTVWNKKREREVKADTSSNGKPRVRIDGKWKLVSHMVAEKFLDAPPPDRTELHHRNGNHAINRNDNLIWLDPETHKAIHTIAKYNKKIEEIYKKLETEDNEYYDFIGEIYTADDLIEELEQY